MSKFLIYSFLRTDSLKERIMKSAGSLFNKRIFQLSFLAFLLLIPLTYAAASAASDAAIKGLENTAIAAYGEKPAEKDLVAEMGRYVGIALSFLGIVFFLIIIYAGFLWMTARGDQSKVEKAHEMIFQAVGGILIIFMAYAITKFLGSVLQKK